MSLGSGKVLSMSLEWALRWIGLTLPDVPGFSAIPNRILRPLHRRLGLGGGEADVLGFRMVLDPNEYVDARLWFQPAVYDRREREYALANVPADGVFLDVGANIGFWSLWLAKNRPQARIIAFEANPKTADIMSHNVELNGFDNIELIGCGVGDTNSTMPLKLNVNGNRGGDSFKVEGRDNSIPVEVRRISELIRELNVEKIDFLKIDVEGMEEPVFTDLFVHCPKSVWPRIVCAETIHSPGLSAMLHDAGYAEVVKGRENHVFRLG